MNILFIICLFVIYIKFGLLILIQIILLSLTFFLSNLLLGLNPFDYKLQLIRIMSILLILSSLYYNFHGQYYLMAILALSIDKISYLKTIENNPTLVLDTKLKFKIFELDVKSELEEWLDKLDWNKNFSCTIYFASELHWYSIDLPIVILSEPILINKFSSSITISNYINERLQLAINCYYLDDSILEQKDKNEARPYITISYREFSII